MPGITDPLDIRGVRLKNRLVMAPMVTRSLLAARGEPHFNERHVEHYEARARAGTGLVIVQSTGVWGATDHTAMWAPESTDAMRRMAEAVHRHGARIMIQLAPADTDINNLSADAMLQIRTEMEQAAVNACDAGFDGVEYHGAHGFALCKFLDAAYNRRGDAYGGPPENRARVITSVLPAVRARTRPDFILSARVGEYTPASEDGIAMARLLEAAGLDMLSVSFGMQPPAGPVPPDFPFSPITLSGWRIKQAVGIPVIGVNEIRTPEQARMLVERGYADLAGIGRAMLADADFARYVLEGGTPKMCRNCPRCRWFEDPADCPARR